MSQKIEVTGEILGGVDVREGTGKESGKPYRLASFKMHVGHGEILDVNVEPDQEHLIKEGPAVIEVRQLGAYGRTATARLVKFVDAPVLLGKH